MKNWFHLPSSHIYRLSFGLSIIRIYLQLLGDVSKKSRFIIEILTSDSSQYILSGNVIFEYFMTYCFGCISVGS